MFRAQCVFALMATCAVRCFQLARSSFPPIALLEAGGAAASTTPSTLIASGALPPLAPLVSGARSTDAFLVVASPSTGEILFLSTPTPALVCSVTVDFNASDPWIGVAVSSSGDVVTATAAGAMAVWSVEPSSAGGRNECTAAAIATLPSSGQTFTAFTKQASVNATDTLFLVAGGETSAEPSATTTFELSSAGGGVPSFKQLWKQRPLANTSGLHLVALAMGLFEPAMKSGLLYSTGRDLVVSSSADGHVFVHAQNGSLVASAIMDLANVNSVVVLDTVGSGQQTIVVLTRTLDASGSRGVALRLNESHALQVVGSPLILDDIKGSEWAAASAASVYPKPQADVSALYERGSLQQLVGLRTYSSNVSGSAFPVNVLVYGDGGILARRRRAVDGTLGQQGLGGAINVTVGEAGEINTTALLELYALTSTNTHNFELCSKAHYSALLSVLQATSGLYVNRQPFRVWVELLPPTEALRDKCLPPDDSPLTPFNETSFFQQNSSDYLDYEAWGSLLGALAALPFAAHLTAVNMDDMSHDIAPPSGIFSPELVATMLGNLRRRAPWVNFAPTIYYSEDVPVFEAWPDLSLTLDAPLFYFRNQKRGAGPCAAPACVWGPSATEHVGGCLAGPCSEPTAWNVADEVADIVDWLPAGRRPLVGFYATGHSSLGSPTAQYVASVLSALGAVDALGIVVYTFVAPGAGNYCGAPDGSGPDGWLIELFAKGCAVRDAFGAMSGVSSNQN